MHKVTEIFKNHSSELLMVSYSYLKDLDAARDAVANCFEKLLLNEIVLERSEEEIKAWLFVVVKNHSLDLLKVSLNRKRLLSYLTFDFFTNSNWQSKVEHDYMLRILKLLSPKESEIFKLHLEGYSNDEIKDKLNVSYATVKNQLYDAKKKLRKIWEITGGLIVLLILK